MKPFLIKLFLSSPDYHGGPKEVRPRGGALSPAGGGRIRHWPPPFHSTAFSFPSILCMFAQINTFNTNWCLAFSSQNFFPHNVFLQLIHLRKVFKLASLEATLVQNYHRPNHRVTGVKCRSSSVSKNGWTAMQQILGTILKNHSTSH